jgi:hypothetical protein
MDWKCAKVVEPWVQTPVPQKKKKKRKRNVNMIQWPDLDLDASPRIWWGSRNRKWVEPKGGCSGQPPTTCRSLLTRFTCLWPVTNLTLHFVMVCLSSFPLCPGKEKGWAALEGRGLPAPSNPPHTSCPHPCVQQPDIALHIPVLCRQLLCYKSSGSVRSSKALLCGLTPASGFQPRTLRARILGAPLQDSAGCRRVEAAGQSCWIDPEKQREGAARECVHGGHARWTESRS